MNACRLSHDVTNKLVAFNQTTTKDMSSSEDEYANNTDNRMLNSISMIIYVSTTCISISPGHSTVVD